ncbi:cyclic-phosphate processing receiver domain-containing protein [Agromyces humi]|uniref:cyclic-phosphate processing receiver domain-containing protein n=1 Tax=Agromyces humi TaxID=1766800 RepID=UPI00135BFD9A|nr:cyclic-phosphate processing receiver domain-containing protein [Agromyces humi]
MTRLWIDDERPAPAGDDWVVARTSAEAIALLEQASQNGPRFDEISFDHDLGMVGGRTDDTRPVMLWLCEHGTWPGKVVVHTGNPIGRTWLVGMARRYGAEGMVVIG